MTQKLETRSSAATAVDSVRAAARGMHDALRRVPDTFLPGGEAGPRRLPGSPRPGAG